MEFPEFIGTEKIKEIQEEMAKYFKVDLDNVKIQQQDDYIVGVVEVPVEGGLTEVQHFRIKN
jgi:septum formation topological specificity factor MinE